MRPSPLPTSFAIVVGRGLFAVLRLIVVVARHNVKPSIQAMLRQTRSPAEPCAIEREYTGGQTLFAVAPQSVRGNSRRGMMMRTTMAFTLALLLGGCATQAERAAQQQREVDEMIAVYGPACQRLGYANGSDQWRSCILTSDTRDAIARYRTAPTTTTCFGHRGFFDCSSF